MVTYDHFNPMGNDDTGNRYRETMIDFRPERGGSLTKLNLSYSATLYFATLNKVPFFLFVALYRYSLVGFCTNAKASAGTLMMRDMWRRPPMMQCVMRSKGSNILRQTEMCAHRALRRVVMEFYASTT
uniref:Uncharacterized protein n=1 Tax=Anopheles culicifacies TaxID=139723 RepID=A0A182LSX5_9DIPT